MRRIPKKLKEEMLHDDPYYNTCARNRVFNDHDCENSRITLEHSMYWQGRQLNEKWAILPICAKAHGVDQYQDNGMLDKEKHEVIALNRASEERLKEMSKATDYIHKRDYLNDKYDIMGTGNNIVSHNPNGREGS